MLLKRKDMRVGSSALYRYYKCLFLLYFDDMITAAKAQFTNQQSACNIQKTKQFLCQLRQSLADVEFYACSKFCFIMLTNLRFCS